VTGHKIVVASWVTVAIFAAVLVPDAAGLRAFDDLAVGVSLAWFLGSLPIWCYAYFKGIARTAAGDDVNVVSLFFLTGSAPKDVRRHLMGALVVSILIAAATARANPFSVLVPMLPLGFAGVWGARHGVYPPRRAPARNQGGRR
jgi:hypothetical protein